MQTLTRLTLALAAGVVAVPAVADSNSVPLSPEAVKAHEAAVSANAARQAKQQRKIAPAVADGVSTKAATATYYPDTPHANGYRTYPPSCAADPLPDSPSGPLLAQERIPLYARDTTTGDAFAENVTLTIWRLACSSSTQLTPYNGDGGKNSITLMRIDRDANANPNRYVTFPFITVSQNGSPFDDTPYSQLRAATEPNTVISDTPFSAPVAGNGVTYVLENYPYLDFYSFFYNYAFTLRVDPVLDGVAPIDIAIGEYNPSQSDYPDAFNVLPFDGYAAAQWVGKTRPDDGLLVQISEQWTGVGADATYSRQLVFDLLTKDQNGNAIWLVGNAPFNKDALTVTTDAFYITGPRPFPHWGKVTFTFPHCNRLDMSFTPDGGLPAPVPVITGNAEYTRLFSANGMMCE